MSTLYGVDVSNWQGAAIDWAAVAGSGQAFAFCKAVEGTWQDPTFTRNWSGIAAHGMVRGAYAFLRPDVDPVAQADALLRSCAGLRPDDILVGDLEVGSGDLRDWAWTWVQRLEASTGKIPVIYSYRSFLAGHLMGDPRFSPDPLWLAAYQAGQPWAPAPWNSWDCWQFTDSATVPGIPGLCDQSVSSPAGLAHMAGTTHLRSGPMKLNAPIVKCLPVPGGPDGAVWFVAADGGVFAEGGAGFKGGMGGQKLNAPIVDAVAGPGGYTLIGADGGTFRFGGPTIASLVAA